MPGPCDGCRADVSCARGCTIQFFRVEYLIRHWLRWAHCSVDLFAGVPADVVVIDTGNYYPTRDGRITAIEQGQPESAWLAEQIGR